MKGYFIVNIYLKTKSHKAVGEEFLKQFKREDPRDKYIRELVKACLECDGKHFQQLV
jgi:hypothetical protein